jgi:hypothetical protein
VVGIPFNYNEVRALLSVAEHHRAAHYEVGLDGAEKVVRVKTEDGVVGYRILGSGEIRMASGELPTWWKEHMEGLRA